MKLRRKIEQLLESIEKLKANPSDSVTLPQNTFYLGDNDILCMEREVGENRYPYSLDGLVVWARSSGYIEARESMFDIFKPIPFTEDPSVSFFAGIPNGKCEFFPISVLGSASQLFEPDDINRYVVYSPACAYYITDMNDFTFAVRLHIDSRKHIIFTYIAINKTEESRRFYLNSGIEAILRFRESEDFWDRMTKFGKVYPDGTFMLRSEERTDSTANSLVINRKNSGGRITAQHRTVGKSDLLGGVGRTLSNAKALKEGEYSGIKTSVNTTDIPIASEIIHYELEAGGYIRQDYDLYYCHDLKEAEAQVGGDIDTESIETDLLENEKKELDSYGDFEMKFGDWDGDINIDVLNRFLVNVQKQVNLCALGKNYVDSFIGIRDVMQQLEASLIWQPEKSREKIITALNYILEDGRPPRQFSLPATENAIPEMDLRKFIDQGVWVISTLYTYLAFTDDYSILGEECCYYVASEDNTYITRKSDIKDTVFDHIIRICEYLASNLDYEDGTYCLRALYGDWNDALNGLGHTKREGLDYGTGVTVMATLQYWQNLNEMQEILEKVGNRPELSARYKELAEKIESGLKRYAIDENAEGKKKIIHGWGDLRSYKLGSFCDPDGIERNSTTAHSFWALSGMIEKTPELKTAIMNAFNSSSSKYGFKTFDKPFPQDLYYEAGRICNITVGTYENSAAYVHAGMFAIMALFKMGESRRAFSEMEKAMVISHKNCTRTSFVMPNSYCENEEYFMDGDSMGDWYTGSGTVLIKELVKFGFGISPDLNGVFIQTPSFLPCKKATVKLNVKGHIITLSYENKGNGKRTYKIDGAEVSGEYDTLMNTEKIYIKTADIKDNMHISVED